MSVRVSREHMKFFLQYREEGKGHILETKIIQGFGKD
jgi:hypothetical protein